MQTNSTMEYKILEATVQLVEQEGINAITIRKIANLADVNVAAINYYFRNKQGLIDALYQFTINNAFSDWYILLDKKELSIKERVRSFLEEMITGGMRFPGITKAHLYDTFINNNYNNPFVSELNKFMKKLSHEIAKACPDKDQRHICWLLNETISAITFFIAMPDLYQPYCKITFKKTSSQKEYIDYLVAKLFPENC